LSFIKKQLVKKDGSESWRNFNICLENSKAYKLPVGYKKKGEAGDENTTGLSL
jgi:hypothetical protein